MIGCNEVWKLSLHRLWGLKVSGIWDYTTYICCSFVSVKIKSQKEKFGSEAWCLIFTRRQKAGALKATIFYLEINREHNVEDVCSDGADSDLYPAGVFSNVRRDADFPESHFLWFFSVPLPWFRNSILNIAKTSSPHSS